MKSLVKEIIIIVLIIIVLGFFVKPIVIRGNSMLPTLQNGNYVIINRLAYKVHEPSRGDIIVFPYEDGTTEKTLYVKRVIALPGDHLVIEDGKVYINGVEQEETYLADGMETEGDINYIIPEDQVFVMGDNRENSKDSRYFGTVTIKDITGKVVFRFWPLNEIGKV